MKNNKIVLMRHGESTWNALNKFTGWYDAKLTEKGKKEAEKSAKILKKNNVLFDLAYTSMLHRAIETLWIILKKLNQTWIPVKKNWKLNERHYGKLQGLNKKLTEEKYGSEKVKLWRRSYFEIPPQLDLNHLHYPGKDRRYNSIPKNSIPVGESLQLTIKRVIPYWKRNILPMIKKNKKIIIVAHGNSLRALLQYLGKITTKDILNLNVPTGKPIVYEFDSNIKPIEYYYLK